jgi:hypothetical protein
MIGRRTERNGLRGRLLREENAHAFVIPDALRIQLINAQPKREENDEQKRESSFARHGEDYSMTRIGHLP